MYRYPKINYFKYIIFIFLFSFLSFGVASAKEEDIIIKSEFFGVSGDICQLLKAIFDFSVKISGALAVLVIIVGGVYYVVSLGSAEKIKRAKEIIGGAVFGYILILMSFGLFYVLAPQILQCKIEIPKLDLCIGLNCVFNNCENKYGVDKCLAMAIAKQESDFTPDESMDRKYKGLYQISCSEMDSYNKANGTNYTCDQLADPEINGEIACYRFSQTYLNPIYFRGLNIENIYGDDERKKGLMTYLAAGSGSGALNWMIRWANSNYGTTNPTYDQLLEAQYQWGKKLIKDMYNKKCVKDGVATPGCCSTWKAEETYVTCNEDDVNTNGERYGTILKKAKQRMMSFYDRCKEGEEIYKPK